MGTITFPGTCKEVITVGSYGKNPITSGEGPTKCLISKPDILAFGSNIISCDNKGGFCTKSGTSMATPIVTAAVCLMYEKNPFLSNDQIKYYIKKTASELNNHSRRQNIGTINIPNLLDSI